LVESLPELYNVKIFLNINKLKKDHYKKITQEPEGRELDFKIHNGILEFNVPKVHIHSCIVIE